MRKSAQPNIFERLSISERRRTSSSKLGVRRRSAERRRAQPSVASTSAASLGARYHSVLGAKTDMPLIRVHEDRHTVYISFTVDLAFEVARASGWPIVRIRICSLY